MISIKCIDEVPRSGSHAIVCFVQQGVPFSSDVMNVSQRYFPLLLTHFESVGFSGQLGKSVIVPVSVDNALITLMFVGLGKARNSCIDIEHLRRATGTLMKLLHARTIYDGIVVYIPAPSLFAQQAWYVIEQYVIAACLANYKFDDFITDKEKHGPENSNIFIIARDYDKQEIDRGIQQGLIIAQGVNQTRHWIDMPPSLLTPAILADHAQKVAQKNGLGITVFDEEAIKKMGMGGLAAVSAGSHEDCKLIILEYRAAKKDAPTLAFVGKGITFDSGGLSIKPANSMETMKDDMSGGAAVINALQVLAHLKPEVNVIGLIPTSENLPSGTATKPGDIIRFYNGKTAEVKNTDAEGRLILADALSYAVKNYKLDAIIDIATLTGACAYALGPFFSGLMGKDEELLKRVEDAATVSGDRVWRLPFDDDFKPAIVSDVADLCNIGKSSYKAGTITAGFFLYNFVGDVPWAHLDIAGTAFDVPNVSYYGPGATGAGMRLLVALAMRWNSHELIKK